MDVESESDTESETPDGPSEKKSWEELVPALAESGKSHNAVRRHLQIFIFMTGQMHHKSLFRAARGGILFP